MCIHVHTYMCIHTCMYVCMWLLRAPVPAVGAVAASRRGKPSSLLATPAKNGRHEAGDDRHEAEDDRARQIIASTKR